MDFKWVFPIKFNSVNPVLDKNEGPNKYLSFSVSNIHDFPSADAVRQNET